MNNNTKQRSIIYKKNQSKLAEPIEINVSKKFKEKQLKYNRSLETHFKYRTDFDPAGASCTVHFKYRADFYPAGENCTIHIQYEAKFVKKTKLF